MIASLDLNPIDLFSQAFTWGLESLQTLFASIPFIKSIGSFGLAIIVFTLVLRTLLFPLFRWQLSSMRKSQQDMARIGPQMAELRKKYKGQPQKFSQELQKLQRDHGISPAGSMQGCVPLFLQLPILYGLYGAIRNATSAIPAGDRGFLWIQDVSQTSHQACCLISETVKGTTTTDVWNGYLSGIFTHPTVLIVPVLAAITTLIQSRMMLMPVDPRATAQQQSMQQMSQTMSLMMPIFILGISFGFPQGIALYWVTQGVYMIVQQYYLVGWGAIQMPAWLPGAHRETSLTHEGHRRQRETPRSPRTTDTNTGGSGVASTGGNNMTTASAIVPGADAGVVNGVRVQESQPQTKVMGAPVGSPSRTDKGAGTRRRRH